MMMTIIDDVGRSGESEWTSPRHNPGANYRRRQVEPPSPPLSPSQCPSEPQLTAGRWALCMAEEGKA